MTGRISARIRVDLGIAKMDVPEGITSIALFGIDARNDNFRGLSDSIMIITADAEHNSIKPGIGDA